MPEEINIPHIDHAVYDKSFLDSVVVKINHSAKFDKSNKNAIVELINNKYSLCISEEDINLLGYKTLRLKDVKNGLSVKIGDSFIQIRLEGESYISFRDSLLTHTEGFIHTIYQMGGAIEKISIEKTNVWQTRELNADEGNNLRNIAENIFSSPVVAKLRDHYSKDNVKAELTVTLDKDASLYILSAGWIRKDDMALFILSNEGICSSSDLLAENVVSNTMEIMNQGLFNIFHWGVSDSVIGFMTNRK